MGHHTWPHTTSLSLSPTVYRPPGHHTDFIREFADFLSELVLAADRELLVILISMLIMKKICWDQHL